MPHVIDAPAPKQVTYMNQLRMLLVLLRSVEKASLVPEDKPELDDVTVRIRALYHKQRSRCGYPPIEDPLTPQWMVRRRTPEDKTV